MINEKDVIELFKGLGYDLMDYSVTNIKQYGIQEYTDISLRLVKSEKQKMLDKLSKKCIQVSDSLKELKERAQIGKKIWG